MEVLNSIYNFQYGIFGPTEQSTWLGSLIVAAHTSYKAFFLVLCTVSALTIAVILVCLRKIRPKVKADERVPDAGSRFRRRDKALFYGRKMLRKVKNISGQVSNSGQGRKRKMVMKFARRLLQLKKDSDTEQLKVLEPPAEYLQEETLIEDRMPSDALYMLQSIRVFGHFEKPVFLKLCKHTEMLSIQSGSYLFKIGDADENIYIVQNGKLCVSIAGPEGQALTLKYVKPGETVTSLLSFTDVLTGHPNHYKTVAAKAVEDSTVVKLPMCAFQEVFQDSPEVFIRVIQIIMVRLQRVTFTALHQYLGLSAELVNPGTKKGEKRAPQNPQNSSPTKVGKAGRKEDTEEAYEGLLRRKSSGVEGEKRAAPLSSSPVKIGKAGRKEDAEDGFEWGGRRPSGAESDLTKLALEQFVRELGLRDGALLEGKIEIKEVEAGTYLMKEDSNKDVALVSVLSGALLVSQRPTDPKTSEVHMFTAHPGELVGGLAVLTGEPSFFTIRAKHQTCVGVLSKATFYSIMKEHPKVVLYVANSVVRRLSPFVRQVDFALDWLFIESGRAVYRQDDESDSTYIVLSGRLRSVITQKNGKKELVAEYGRGDLLGVVEMVTLTRRSTTVIAVRDSELAKLPEGLFNAIKLRYPIVVTRLIDLLAHRILGTWQNPTLPEQREKTIESRPSQVNFSTIAIVAVSDDVPLTAFTYELFHCLSATGSTVRLTSEVIRKSMGASILDPNNEYHLGAWLAQQEDQHKISLYQCDLTFSAWTQRCIRQADCILIVGLGENPPSLGKVEKKIERLAMRTQKELVLLHREGGRPKNTIAWLNMRSWISSHHHIFSPNRMFSRKSLYRINELYSKVCMSEPNVHSDFSRLARWLAGKSIGIVLGGGGARGSAHIGMIKAIMEAGIPIDMVGGVSIGAFMGALWCQERNITTMTQKAREWSKKMTQWWRQILDLTYPMTSMFSGRDFNQTLRATLGDTYIEDLWLPYFTVTTDITASCMRVHSHGSLWRYVRASMSLSGYMPPLCDPIDGHLLLDGGYVNNLPGHLWRYVRGSMSIVGIFPPICDPVDGHLLADGCYTNNVPADVMRKLGANHILAIDVGSVDDQELTNYGDDLSGWWLLWKRWYPFTESVKVPNLPDIQSRLAYVSCVRQLEEVKSSDYCEYIRPPIDKYRTLQFGSFDEIKEVGYQHGREYFERKGSGEEGGGKRWSYGWLRQGKETGGQTGQSENFLGGGGYKFTDLAQMVCKVNRRYEDSSSTNSEDDEDEFGEEHGYASEPTVGMTENNQSDRIHLRRAGGSLSLSENELESDFELPKKKDE